MGAGCARPHTPTPPVCLRRLLDESRADAFHMLGYCIGATLSVLYAALHPEAPLRTLMLLAPPIDFAGRDESVFSIWL